MTIFYFACKILQRAHAHDQHCLSLGYVSCWGAGTATLSSCLRQAMHRVTRLCCQRRRWRWSRWKSTKEMWKESEICWAPPSFCRRPPLSPHLWKPARWAHWRSAGWWWFPVLFLFMSYSCHNFLGNGNLLTCFFRLSCLLIWRRFETSWQRTSTSSGAWIRLSWAGPTAR